MGFLTRWRRRKVPLLHIAIDEGEGPVVILIHGIASSSNTFSELVPLLSTKHRVIAIDLLGFGESPVPPNATYTINEHVEAVANTIDSLKLHAPFELVGHSMGSLISARYASTNPSRVSRLVMVSPPIYVTPAAIGDPIQRAAMGVYLSVYEYLRVNQAFTTSSARFLQRLSPIKNVLEVSERNWNAFVLSLQNSIESQTTVSDVATVKVPIDIVYGALDPFVFVGGISIVAQMRHVSVHRVDANDHLIRKRLARVVAQVIA
ncbi:MAG: alpha/beta fold hydrolase [Microbacteriaceae bacterium]